VSDGGLRHIAACPALRDLDLGGTAVTDAGLRHLEGVRGLRRLELGYYTRTSPEGVGRLRKALPDLVVRP
jgi:hypothetical protein